MIYCVVAELEDGAPKRSLWTFENVADYLLAREIEGRHPDSAHFEAVYVDEIRELQALRERGELTGLVRHAHRGRSEKTGEPTIYL